jgi:hypothetical protein
MMAYSRDGEKLGKISAGAAIAVITASSPSPTAW